MRQERHTLRKAVPGVTRERSKVMRLLSKPFVRKFTEDYIKGKFMIMLYAFKLKENVSM